MNIVTISFFLGIVGLTLLVTYIAAKKTSNAKDFYTAGGGLTGWQNGLAISGDYLSAATCLGASGAIAATATGLISCIILGAIGPNIWSPTGNAIFVGTPLFPLTNPAIVTVPLGFLAGYLGSKLSSRKVDLEIYEEIQVKSSTGINVSDVSH